MGMRAATASCGIFPSVGTPLVANHTIPLVPATIYDSSDDEDEGSDYTPDPPTPDPPAVASVGEEHVDACDVLFETVGNLWEEQGDLIVHMMEYYPRSGVHPTKKCGSDHQRLHPIREAIGRAAGS